MLHHLMHLATSPWVYLIVALAVTIDAFLPFVPAETLIVSLAAVAVTGTPRPVMLVPAVIAGGMAGDALSYAIGRTAVRRLRGGRTGEAHQKACRALQRHGGLVIVASRFLPGGRTATTLIAGSVGFSAWRFPLFSAIAATAWAIYIVTLGYVGGAAFPHNPLLGAIPGVFLGLAVTAVHYFATRRQGRSRAS